MGERISRLIGIPKIPRCGRVEPLLPPPPLHASRPIGSTSHRIFITVPVTNKLLIPCRVLDSHFCRLSDSFCLAPFRATPFPLTYSIPVPLFIPPPLSPYPPSLFPSTMRAVHTAKAKARLSRLSASSSNPSQPNAPLHSLILRRHFLGFSLAASAAL